MNLAQGFVRMVGFGWWLWVRLLGPKRAPKVVGAGLVASTVLAIYLNFR